MSRVKERQQFILDQINKRLDELIDYETTKSTLLIPALILPRDGVKGLEKLAFPPKGGEKQIILFKTVRHLLHGKPYTESVIQDLKKADQNWLFENMHYATRTSNGKIKVLVWMYPQKHYLLEKSVS